MRQEQQDRIKAAVASAYEAEDTVSPRPENWAARFIRTLGAGGFEIVSKVEVVAPGLDPVLDGIAAEIHAAYDAGQDGHLCLGTEAAARIVRDIVRIGFEIVPKSPAGSAARIGEARRSGDWSKVSDTDWKAWVDVMRVEAPPTEAETKAELARVQLELERLKLARQRLAFEDIDQNPPYGPSLACELISTWVRGFGDDVAWCECALRLRKLVLTASVRRPPTAEQQEDFLRRLDGIRGMRGVVGADYTLGVDGIGCPEPLTVEIRFDHYITTVGCEFTPLDLPARRAA